MLLVLKRTVSMIYFEHSKHMFKLMGKKIFTILRLKNCLSKPVGTSMSGVTKGCDCDFYRMLSNSIDTWRVSKYEPRHVASF